MKIRKWLMTAVMLASMTAALLPGVPASAASVPTDGTGTVIENTTADSSLREFFTIKTADGNVFYIVVDKTKTDDNVYLLTPVTEDSLKALAESATQKNGTTTTSGTSNLFGGQSASSQSSGTTGAATTGSGTSTAAKTQKVTTAASVGNIAFIAIVAIFVFAAAFYFKIYKPRHATLPEALDEEPSRPAQVSTRARVGGLFTPDTPNRGQGNPPQASGAGSEDEPEEPEPEEDENEMDYEDGMDAFGNPDEED